MAYASSSDLTARFDERTILDLLSDTNTPATLPSTRLDTILADSSGELNAHVRVGGRYAVSDLTSLTGDALEYLKGIVCRIAMLRLMQRRPELYASVGEAMSKDLTKTLEDLRNGAMIFDVDGAVDASLLSHTGVDGADLRELNMIPNRTRHYYPERSASLPISRQN